MSSLPTPILPEEIHDLVVDEMASRSDEDSLLGSLRSCLLVSRSYYQQSRRYLWASVTLEPRNQEQADARMSVLLELMSYTPPAYPPTVTVIKSFILDAERTSRHLGNATLRNILGHTALPSILSKLHGCNHGVKYFKFAPQTSWTNLTPELQVSLYAMVRSPRLEHLYFQYFCDIPMSIFNASQIKKLHLHFCHERYLNDGDAPTQAQSNPDEFIHSPPPLETFFTDNSFLFPSKKSMALAVESGHTKKAQISPLSGVKHLQILSLTLPYLYMATEVLLDCLDSLESLKLRFMNSPMTSMSLMGLTLEKLSKLTFLTVEISPMEAYLYPPEAGPGPVTIIAFLELLHISTPGRSSPPSLRRIDLCINFGTKQPFRDSFILEKEIWNEIDATLSGTRNKTIDEINITLSPRLDTRFGDKKKANIKECDKELRALFSMDLLPSLLSSRLVKTSLRIESWGKYN